MTSHTQSSPRATVDVINFWCVAILVISAASVAGVVGAAVVTGEFEDRNFNANASENTVKAAVLMETQPNGNTNVRWAERGDAQYLEIRAGDEVLGQLNYIGEEFVVERGQFQIYAIYDDKLPALVEERG